MHLLSLAVPNSSSPLSLLFLFSPLLPEVIGVAELVNKMNGPWFNRFDEDLATAFSIYCGISIAHVRLRSRSVFFSWLRRNQTSRQERGIKLGLKYYSVKLAVQNVSTLTTLHRRYINRSLYDVHTHTSSVVKAVLSG